MVSSAAAQQIITALRLAPLSREGGFYRPTWRSDAGSAILFLITPDAFSALHRLTETELWHFHAGDPVEHVQLGVSTGALHVTTLGNQVLSGEVPQLVVPAGNWQGARLAAPHAKKAVEGYALLGCTLTRAWDERMFELGDRQALLEVFPQAGNWIRALTR